MIVGLIAWLRPREPLATLEPGDTSAADALLAAKIAEIETARGQAAKEDEASFTCVMSLGNSH